MKFFFLICFVLIANSTVVCSGGWVSKMKQNYLDEDIQFFEPLTYKEIKQQHYLPPDHPLVRLLNIDFIDDPFSPKDLIKQAQEGDSDALNRLIQKIHQHLVHSCYFSDLNPKDFLKLDSLEENSDEAFSAFIQVSHFKKLPIPEDVEKIVSSRANAGSALAQYNFGMILFGKPDEFGANNREKAHEWVSKAAEQGNLRALTQLGIWISEQDSEEMDLSPLIKAAEQGDLYALAWVGVVYINDYNQRFFVHCCGARTINPNLYIENIRVLEKAANLGVLNAQITLGDFYSSVLIRNFKKAQKWYKKAADQGYTEAFDLMWKCVNYGKEESVKIDKRNSL